MSKGFLVCAALIGGVGAGLSTLASAVTPAVASAAPTVPPVPTSATPDKLIVYTSSGAPGASAVGHTFIDLVDTVHPNCRVKACHHIWGKYPGGNWYFDTDGKIKVDGQTGWSWRLAWPINADQYSLAFQFLVAQQGSPSRYKFLSDNCMQWAADLASKAGQSLPKYTNFADVPTPAIFREQLENAGDKATLMGGKVMKNPTPGSAADGAPDPPPASPPCCDVDTVLKQALGQPEQLAQELEVKYSKQDLPADHSNADGTYRVVVTHTNPTRAVYAVSWGDGTHSVVEEPKAVGNDMVVLSHHFASPPTGPLRLVELENGRLTQWVRELSQPPGGTGNGEQVTSPPQPAQTSFS